MPNAATTTTSNVTRMNGPMSCCRSGTVEIVTRPVRTVSFYRRFCERTRQPLPAGLTYPAGTFISPVRTTTIILDRVRRLGYVVKEFRINGTVEFHAVPLDGAPAQVVRCNDGEDDESAYRAACLLAEAVGIDFGDG